MIPDEASFIGINVCDNIVRRSSSLVDYSTTSIYNWAKDGFIIA
jgi:hypothetical protein